MKPKILVIGHVWPEPNSSAAGSRMLQVLELCIAQQWDITFACSAVRGEHAIPLAPEVINSQEITLNDASFDTFITELAPQYVLFDRFMTEEQFGWRVAQQCPKAIRILNTEDLHCLRKSRQYCLQNHIPFEVSQLYMQEITKREIASIYRCDLTIIISKFEMQLLQQQFQISETLLCYLPFLFPPLEQTLINELPSFENRKHFITIGNFRHAPNWDSFVYLKESIWPLIRKQLPEVELHIYGAYPPPKQTQLHAPKEGLFVKGWTENARAVMKNARVCLAPLRFGAGLKGKLVEAMCCGTPNVTTTIGAEAMRGDTAWSGTIHDNPIAFANAAVHLYQNKNEWITAQHNGFQIINSHFQKEKFATQFVQRLRTLFQHREAHRTQNFIGAMLQHHTLRSTEFMSRWIEEKNKN